MTNYILIDGSYFIFYRYYALKSWWKLSHPDDEEIDENEFMEKFEKTFINKLSEIPKKLRIKNYKMMVAKDCRRSDIWRNQLIGNYKGNRINEDSTMIGNCFKIAYDKLFQQGGCELQLYHPKLEADDCNALTTQLLLHNDLTANIWIVANDMDYLQLASEQVNIINLKYKDITLAKHCTKNAKCDLFCKIVMGDKSDNIPSIFKKCGVKTALKYYNDQALFSEKLTKEPGAKELFERNKQIIDFDCIPEDLKSEFYSQYNLIINNKIENLASV